MILLALTGATGQLTAMTRTLSDRYWAAVGWIKAIKKPDMPANAINNEPLKRALKELSATAPQGEIKGQPRSSFK